MFNLFSQNMLRAFKHCLRVCRRITGCEWERWVEHCRNKKFSLAGPGWGFHEVHMNLLKQKWHSPQKKKKNFGCTSVAFAWERTHEATLYTFAYKKRSVSCILAFRELSNFLKITNSLQMSLQKGFKKIKKKVNIWDWKNNFLPVGANYQQTWIHSMTRMFLINRLSDPAWNFGSLF